jgi:hypothetical protein
MESLVTVQPRQHKHQRPPGSNYEYAANQAGGGGWVPSDPAVTFEYFVLRIGSVELSGVWWDRKAAERDAAVINAAIAAGKV